MSTASGVQKRSVGKVFILSIVTFGLYGLLVMHKYHQEFEQESQLDPSLSPTIRTVLMIVPLGNFYAIWLFCQDVESLTGESAVKLFVLWFFIIGYWMAMSALSSYAS